MFQTIEEKSDFELTEKKSKFIACLMYVKNKEEAENKIKEFKKKYFDARHNCSAYRVFEEGVIYEKSSDDGEPSATAGAPMLNILKKNDLCNVLVVVTRYFGGILLGTGGLVRCYSNSTIGAIKLSKKIIIKEGISYELEFEYNCFETFKYYSKKKGFFIKNIQFGEKIKCDVELEEKDKIEFLEDIKEKRIEINNFKEIGKVYIKM